MAMSGTIQGKRAELFVFGELLKRGAIPYAPVADVERVDAVVRTAHGKSLAIQIKSAGVSGSKSPGWFQVDEAKPADEFFVILVEAPGGQIGDAWILPSKVFDAYAASPPKGRPRDLDLDGGKRKFGQPLREVLCGFKNRWELLTNYEDYASLFANPKDLEDILTMQDALDSPEGQMITLEECERRRRDSI